jgi:hypothetical protein
MRKEGKLSVIKIIRAVKSWFAASCFACLVVIILASNTPAQVRPVVVDEGEVKETKRKSLREFHAILMPKSKMPSRMRPAGNSGVLFVLIDPPDALIEIDGKVAGRAIDGEFRKELASGKQYTISVKAGPGYEPIERRITLRPGRPEILRVDLISKYGRVRFGPAIEGAKILVDDKPLDPSKYSVDKTSGLIIIDEIQPGEHTITYDHPDYVIVEKRLKVSAGSEYSWTFLPKRATVELTVKSTPGALVYIDGEPRGESPANGILKVNDISPGRHEVRITREGFEDYKQIVEFEFQKPVLLEKELVPVTLSSELGEDFSNGLASWDAPASWQAKGGKVNVKGPGVGLIRSYMYKDFKMVIDVRFVNGKGAAWVVRARDKQNYYLFQLTGPNSEIPNRFQSYIYKNGQAQLLVSTSLVTDLSRPDDAFSITIEAKGPTIKHYIEQYRKPNAGGPEPLGLLTDSSFSYGAVGAGTKDGEEFILYTLFVAPTR